MSAVEWLRAKRVREQREREREQLEKCVAVITGSGDPYSVADRVDSSLKASAMNYERRCSGFNPEHNSMFYAEHCSAVYTADDLVIYVDFDEKAIDYQGGATTIRVEYSMRIDAIGGKPAEKTKQTARKAVSALSNSLRGHIEYVNPCFR